MGIKLVIAVVEDEPKAKRLTPSEVIYKDKEIIMRTKKTAYLLWLPSLIGLAGFQRFYLGKIGTGIIWFFTLGIFGIGTLVDLFSLGGQVETKNNTQRIKELTPQSE